jgi:hypothetical protein
MATSVIEGFLVQLGFKVDADAQARFNRSVADAGKRLTGISVKAAAALAAIGAGWAKTTSSIAGDHNLAKWAGSSIRGLNVLHQAFKNAGGDASQIDAAMTEMTKRFRTIPGYADAFKNVLGVSMTDSQGNLRDTSDIMKDVAVAMQGMDDAAAAQAAQFLGLGDTWQILKDKDFPKYLAEAEKQVGSLGNNLDETSESSVRLTNSLNNLLATALLGIKSIISQLNNTFHIDKWIDKITEKIPGWANSVSDTATAVVRTEKRLWNESDGFWGWLSDWLNPEVTDTKFQKELDRVAKERAEKEKKNKQKERGEEVKSPTTGNYKGASIPRGIRNNNPGNIRGSDGQFKTFATMDEGVYQLARQLKMYQNAGAKTVADMVSNWAPASENNTVAYANAVSRYLSARLGANVGWNTALNLSDPRVLAAMTEAITQHENGDGWQRAVIGPQFADEYLRAAQVQAKSRAWSASRNQLSQSTTVNQNITVSDRNAARDIARLTRREIDKAADTRALGRALM